MQMLLLPASYFVRRDVDAIRCREPGGAVEEIFIHSYWYLYNRNITSQICSVIRPINISTVLQLQVLSIVML